MNLISPKTIKELLESKGAFPKKGLGQNFLINQGVLEKIIEASSIHPKDIVLEIGPGLGVLTRELAKRAVKVIAIEKDLKMAEILKETLADFSNVKIIPGDVLKFPFPLLSPTKEMETEGFYKIVANLPYYITSPVIRKFLESAEVKPTEMVLMVQKEVAQRIVAKPPRMNLLAASVQFYAKPEIISYVSKNSFWPSPKVDSAIIRITPDKQPPRNQDLFFKVIKAGFSQPRKQLLNNLSKGLKLSKKETEKIMLKNKIQPQQRAETMSLEHWQRLIKDFKAY